MMGQAASNPMQAQAVQALQATMQMGGMQGMTVANAQWQALNGMSGVHSGMPGGLTGGLAGGMGAAGMPRVPPGSMAGPSGVQMRPGDWICQACNNHNYADKIACNRCRVPKPGQWHGMPGGGPTMRQGDWICRACANHNYADKTSCNRCKLEKNVYITATGMREGDWICPSCNNHNYADKTACNKCAVPKAAMHIVHVGKSSTASSKRLRDEDWVCNGCRNVNYASRVVCNRCGMRPTGATQKIGGGALNSAAPGQQPPSRMLQVDQSAAGLGSVSPLSRSPQMLRAEQQQQQQQQQQQPPLTSSPHHQLMQPVQQVRSPMPAASPPPPQQHAPQQPPPQPSHASTYMATPLNPSTL